MHLTITVVAALSTANKIGLATVGAIFIAFALISSFVLPRRNPNFPGKHVGWYSALAVLFLIAMISAVLVFGVESEETEATGGEARTETVSSPLPGQGPGTTTGETTTEAPTTTGEDDGGDDGGGNSGPGGGGNSGPGGGAEGDAAAGKSVFASAGCGGCHTLKAAGSSGNVGPNLDELHPDFSDVKDQVEHGGGGMPPYEGELSDKQIEDVAAYVSSSAGS